MITITSTKNRGNSIRLKMCMLLVSILSVAGISRQAAATTYYSYVSAGQTAGNLNFSLMNANGDLLNWNSSRNGRGSTPNINSISDLDIFIIGSGHTMVTSANATLTIGELQLQNNARLVINHIVNLNRGGIRVIGTLELNNRAQLLGTGKATLNGVISTTNPSGLIGNPAASLGNDFSDVTQGAYSDIRYQNDGDQLISALPDYRLVEIAGGGVKELTGNLTIKLNGSLTLHAGSTLTSTANNYQVFFSSSTNAMIYGSVVTYDPDGFYGNANTTFGLAGSVSGFSIQFGPNAVIEYSRNGSQAVSALNYQNLKFSNSTSRTFPANGTVGVAGSFDPGSITSIGGTINFNGLYTQYIPGITYNNLYISNSGDKILQGNIIINGELRMTYGRMVTGNYLVDLEPTAKLNEQNESYINGEVRITRILSNNTPEDFGGIGLSIMPGISPGSTTVTRKLGIAYSDLNGTPSIKRSFHISANNVPPNMNATLTFNYMATPDELNGIDETKLAFYKSEDGGSSWLYVGGSVDTNRKIVSVAGVNGFSLWTLGNSFSPLPVELYGFRAEKAGADVLLHWSTAMEKDNAGFAIEVSEDAENYRRLAFVPSRNGNAKGEQRYSYTDRENGKHGTRYYRIRQQDTNGTSQAFGPVAVTFREAAAAVTVYPTAFKDALHLNIHAEQAGEHMLILSTLSGQHILTTTVRAAKGTSVYSIPTGRNLAAGAYLLQVSSESGNHTFRLFKK